MATLSPDPLMVEESPRATIKRSGPGWWRKLPAGPLIAHRSGDVFCGDALECLGSLDDDVADIVFLDPPFNLGKTYGVEGPRADRLDEVAYQDFVARVIREAHRVLRPGGAIFLYHIPKWAIRFTAVLEENFQFQHWIAVSMKNGFVRGSRLYPAHYALVHYSKGDALILNRPKIPPATCPHCDEYIRDYGGYKSHIENGVNLSDVWDDLSPVRHSKYKHREANELPLALLRRVVGMSGRRDGLLVDPFAGTGTSVIAARLARMKYVAGDREPDHCATIQARLDALAARKRATQYSEG
ncbi:MAG TPA: site-specific DNA-methyltransferase [Longimicrobium sp.]|jgi:site-specific DNA-methyltransferase (adenine-specific)|uniref:DNA-methyltransferase n=1 Tax=Longimicrobium sp. TaxID=2029185 RepID=UPI002EDAEADE